MYQSVIPLIGWTVTVLVSGLAWWKGGPAERASGLLIVGAAFAVWLAHLLLRPAGANLALLVIDGAMAAGFLLLAIRYANLWLGVAMLLQSTQFSLHSFYLVTEKSHDRLYSIANNLITLGVVLCVLFGTLTAWRRARKAAEAG